MKKLYVYIMLMHMFFSLIAMEECCSSISSSPSSLTSQSVDSEIARAERNSRVSSKTAGPITQALLAQLKIKYSFESPDNVDRLLEKKGEVGLSRVGSLVRHASGSSLVDYGKLLSKNEDDEESASKSSPLARGDVVGSESPSRLKSSIKHRKEAMKTVGLVRSFSSSHSLSDLGGEEFYSQKESAFRPIKKL